MLCFTQPPAITQRLLRVIIEIAHLNGFDQRAEERYVRLHGVAVDYIPQQNR